MKRSFLRQNKTLAAALSLFFILLIVCLLAYLEMRGEYLLRDFKIFVEKGLSKALNSNVSIGDVRGGVFYPITFSNIILYASPERDRKLLEIETLSVNYRLWDILFSWKKKDFRMKLVGPKFYLVRREEIIDRFKNGKIVFLGEHVQLDVVNGAVVSQDESMFIIKEANGRAIFTEHTIRFDDINMNLYGLPIKINGKMNELYSESPYFDLHFEFRNEYVRVLAETKGRLYSLETRGRINVTHDIDVAFSGKGGFAEGSFRVDELSIGNVVNIDEGDININERKFSVKILDKENEESQFTAGGSFDSWPLFSLYGEARHWKINGIDISTNVNLKGEFKRRANTPVISATAETSNSVLNYKPCEELSLQFTTRRKAIEILGFKWGKTLRLVGKLELEPPYNVELIALLDGTKLEEIVSFGNGGLANAVSGTIKGRLEIDGPLMNPVSSGRITATNGNIGDVYYENTVIHLIGKGPIVSLGDSRIYKEVGHFILTGDIDFRKLGKRNIFEDIVVRTDDQTIVWDGWDITKEASADEVNLKKRIGEELEVGFKASTDKADRLNQEELEKSGEVELKYKLKYNESLKMQIKEEEEFLGVEHKVKF